MTSKLNIRRITFGATAHHCACIWWGAGCAIADKAPHARQKLVLIHGGFRDGRDGKASTTH